MAYAQLDEHFDEHPKFGDLDLEHFGLMACAFSYCNRLLTDGFVSERAVRGFGKGRRGNRVAARLVEKGIWMPVSGGYQVVGYLDHNPSREVVIARREGARTRKENQRKRNVAQDVTPDVTRESQRPLNYTALHSTEIHRSSPPTPSRGGADERAAEPVFVGPELASGVALKAGTVSRTKAPKGMRIPECWKPSEAVLAWAAAEGIQDPLGALEEFADFWRGQPGQRGVRTDWDATYRNRLRQLVESGRIEIRKTRAAAQMDLAPIADDPESDVTVAEAEAALERELAALHAATRMSFDDLEDPHEGGS